MKNIHIIFIIISLVINWNCESEKSSNNERVVIGIASDAETLNPLFSVSLTEGQINELIYLGLVKHNWDDSISDIKSSPLLAEKWEWNKDSTSITFNLRENLFWSDGAKLTTEDVVFSFDIYSDPQVGSKFFGSYDNMFLEKDQHIDIAKTFEILSPLKVKINFQSGAKPSLFDVDMPILPKHVLSKIPRKDLSTTNFGKDAVTNGPFTLSSWKKNEAIILKAVPNSFLFKETMVKELIFKIVPDENSRLTQLKKGEIDIIEDINTEAVPELKKFEHIKVVTRTGRDYDYIGWNNIDPKLFSKNKTIKSHKFFGSANVRKALSYAINRQEILAEYLQGFGKLCFGPISPIFSNYYNKDITPFDYSPSKAKELLAGDGWVDTDRDGIIDKNNEEFSFTIYIGSGNPRRTYAATVVKNNLKAAGIDVTIETMEMSAFINKLFQRELDAWMAGWTIPIPLDIQPYWHSDFNRSPFNFSSFNNKQMDELLNDLEKEKNIINQKIIYKKIQQILHENEPVTFLYWLDINTAYNSRIKNINIDPLGAIQHCWEWEIRSN